MEIRNEFNHSIKPSQKKWLDSFKSSSREIIEVSLTRGGYLSVDYKRKSKKYPYGRIIRGVRAGWVSNYVAKEYDKDDNVLLDGVMTDEFGTRKFISA